MSLRHRELDDEISTLAKQFVRRTSTAGLEQKKPPVLLIGWNIGASLQALMKLDDLCVRGRFETGGVDGAGMVTTNNKCVLIGCVRVAMERFRV